MLGEAGGIPDVDPAGEGLEPAPGDRKLLLERGAEGADLGRGELDGLGGLHGLSIPFRG